MNKLIILALSIFTLTSCQLANIADDFVFVKPNGPDPQPIVVCEDTTMVTQPEFITIYNEYFNGLPVVDTNFYFNKSQGVNLAYPSLQALLIAQGYNADSIQVFEEGNSIAAIIRGTNNKTPIENKIWTRDAAGQKALFTSSIQGFLFGGALTFDEYKQIAIDLPSVRRFNFRNTNWTQEQYEEVASIILGECKLGREEANFMFNSAPISDSLYCQFRVMKWVIVRGQPFNCDPLPLVNPSMLRARIYAQEKRISYGIPQ